MKEITCYDCEKVFRSETSEDMLNQLHAHYMEVHKEIITNVDEEGKKAWMKRFHEDWERAENA